MAIESSWGFPAIKLWFSIVLGQFTREVARGYHISIIIGIILMSQWDFYIYIYPDYPLVNCPITMERSTISMVIFNSWSAWCSLWFPYVYDFSLSFMDMNRFMINVVDMLMMIIITVWLLLVYYIYIYIHMHCITHIITDGTGVLPGKCVLTAQG